MINLVNHLIKLKVNFIVIKQGLRISAKMDMQTKVIVTMFSLFSELERDIVSERTKSAFAAKKAAGKKLGKPKGTIQKSSLDDKQDVIRELLNIGWQKRQLPGWSELVGQTSSSTSVEGISANIL